MSDEPNGRNYTDFEIPLEARNNIREIEKCIRTNCYDSEAMCRDHLDLLENIDAEVANAMSLEKSIGRYNATLKHDQEKIRKLIAQLEVKLNEFDRI